MKSNRKTKRIAALAVLALFSWAAVAVASGPYYANPRSDAGPTGGTASGSFINGIQTINDSAYHTVATIGTFPGTAMAGHIVFACTAVSTPSGGSAGDYAVASLDFAAKMNPGATTPVIEGTTPLSSFAASSLAGVGVQVTAAAGFTSDYGNIVVSISTVSVGTIDCNVTTSWTQVN